MRKNEGEIRAGYKPADFMKLERGKFFKEAANGASVILLDPEIAKAFPTSESANDALRGLPALTKQTARIARRSARPGRKCAVT